jgi:hypothetical protein
VRTTGTRSACTNVHDVERGAVDTYPFGALRTVNCVEVGRAAAC